MTDQFQLIKSDTINHSETETSDDKDDTDSEDLLNRDIDKARLYNQDLIFIQYCHELNKYTETIV